MQFSSWIEKIARGLAGIEPAPLCIEFLLELISAVRMPSLFSSVGESVIKVLYLLYICLNLHGIVASVFT